MPDLIIIRKYCRTLNALAVEKNYFTDILARIHVYLGDLDVGIAANKGDGIGLMQSKHFSYMCVA